MDIRPGTRLHSPTASTAIVVVRAPGTELTVDCAGQAMVAPDEAPANPESTEGEAEVLLGKRYEHADLGVEVLCTKAGPGPLSIDGEVLTEKGAKPLPSSD